MDEELQDEVVMNYVASPILSEFKNQRTPQRVMTLLCDMPGGSHDAGKERHLRQLASAADLHDDDTRKPC